MLWTTLLVTIGIINIGFGISSGVGTQSKCTDMQRRSTPWCSKQKATKENKNSMIQRIVSVKHHLILLNMIRKLHKSKDPAFAGKERKFYQIIHNLEALYKAESGSKWKVRSVVV